MTSAEFWGEMLRETRGDDWRKFHDLDAWLHCYGSEDHEVITSDMQEEENCYCFHLFSDASILDCDTGEVVTFEDAVKKIGYAEVTIGLLWGKTDVAMVNETLCKILCHNLVVLIHEMCELGIDPVFWPIAATS
jgi:hypothetical protein